MTNGADIKDRFQSLCDHDVEMIAGLDFYLRGETYFLEKRVFDTVVRGSEIYGRCEGSAGGPYRVHAALASIEDTEAKNLSSYSCDCSREGFCKHIVALVLTWVNTPERFTVEQEAGVAV